MVDTEQAFEETDEAFSEKGNEDHQIGNSKQDLLDFGGELKKIGATITVTAGGAALIYAFGIIVVIAVLIAAIVALAVYLRFKQQK